MSTWKCPGCGQPLHRVGEATHVIWAGRPCSLTWVTRESFVSVLGAELLKKLTDGLECEEESNTGEANHAFHQSSRDRGSPEARVL